MLAQHSKFCNVFRIIKNLLKEYFDTTLCYMQTDANSNTHYTNHWGTHEELIKELKAGEAICILIDVIVPKYNFIKRYKTIVPKRE